MLNPFITTGYAGAEYFCDRKQETKDITTLIQNNNNIALISHRRVGKTDLIRHCLSQKSFENDYYCFIIDIYSTRSFAGFVNLLGSTILNTLKPKGKQNIMKFLNFLKSLQHSITYDITGQPTWNIKIEDIKAPEISLKEIFHYLQNANKRCVVAIDEFQQICNYPEDNVEAILREYIQYCSNANFIFSGSSRNLMGKIFLSSSNPFYQSVTIINLPLIDKQEYIKFCQYHFEKNNKSIDPEVINTIYEQFNGITLYMQKIMNILFFSTQKKQHCTIDMLQPAIDYVIRCSNDTYENLLYQFTEKQNDVLVAIAKEHIAKEIFSNQFVKKHNLTSPNSVQSIIKTLLKKDIIIKDKDEYQIYDKILELWIINKYA